MFVPTPRACCYFCECWPDYQIQLIQTLSPFFLISKVRRPSETSEVTRPPASGERSCDPTMPPADDVGGPCVLPPDSKNPVLRELMATATITKPRLQTPPTLFTVSFQVLGTAWSAVGVSRSLVPPNSIRSAIHPWHHNPTW